MEPAIQGGRTVLSRIVEIHKPFSIAFVFAGKIVILGIGVSTIETELTSMSVKIPR